MHHASNVGAGLIDLTMNASFIGRFEAGLSFQALPFQIGQENVAGLGKEKPGLVGPSAPDQHLISLLRALTWPVVSLKSPSLARMRHDSATFRAKERSVFTCPPYIDENLR